MHTVYLSLIVLIILINVPVDVNKPSPDNSYIAQIVYEDKGHDEWLMHFIVAKHLDVLLEVSKKIMS